MNNAIEYILGKIGNFKPDMALILGSGLGSFLDKFEGIRIPYTDIPEFVASNVIGHKNQLVFTNIEGKNVVCMQGRIHYYEGHSLSQVILPVKIFKKLGVSNLIVTNAAGLINTNFNIGDFMLIKDHINNIGVDPLRGENDSSLGDRFPDMSEVYKRDLIEKAKDVAKNLGIKIREGVYCANSGPSYETPAEIRVMRSWGVDAVGMSTVPEATVANYCGIKVLGISCLTNYACGIVDTPLSHKEVIETANSVKNNFEKLISNIIKAI